MKFTHEGLSLWYGTPDAPAPLDEVVPRVGVSVVVGVHPPGPSNAVEARYRVDGGIVQTAPGRELRTDYSRKAQYYLVTFPPFVSGSTVDYCPVLSSAGRQVPDPSLPARFPSRFMLPPTVAPATETRATRARAAPGQRFALELTYLASVTVEFDEPLFVGETPEGVRIDFIVRDGSLVGPGIRGKVLRGSSDHMFVRPDGIGVIRVRAAIAMDDGAMLEVENNGSVEFGSDGYERAKANRLPAHSLLVLTPRILTSHPKYSWLNRLQCFGAGRTRLDELVVEYDLFGPKPATLPAGG